MAKDKINNSTGQVDLDQIAESDNTDDAKFDLDAFFGGLEKTVTGAMFDEGGPTYSKGNTDEKAVQSEEDGSKTGDSEEIDGELVKLKKRYADSSKEAKRLAQELKRYQEYEQFIPVLDVMREDPNLLKQVRSYLEDGSTPQSIVRQLNLSEDFVYDADEAIKDPSSESAKVFNAMMDAAVTRRLSLAKQKDREQQQVNQSRAQEQELISDFQTQHKLSDDDMEEFLDWAKTEKLTLEHLWFLKNRDRRDRDILNGSFEERQRQLEKMKQTPRTLGGKNAPSKSRSEDDVVFDAILGVANSGAIFTD